MFYNIKIVRILGLVRLMGGRTAKKPGGTPVYDYL